MDINEKAIAENLADMQLGESGFEGLGVAVKSADQGKKPCKQAMRHQMRLQMKMMRDMDSTSLPFAPPAPWGARRHPFGPRHSHATLVMNHRHMMPAQWPMMYHMPGPMGPMWNALIMHGPVGHRQPKRHQTGCQHAPKAGSPQTQMMFAGPKIFDNHPFFMRRKFRKMANKEAKEQSPQKEDSSVDHDNMERDPDVTHSKKGQNVHKAGVHPFFFHPSGYPPFMTVHRQKCGKNKRQEEETAKLDTSGEDTGPEEAGVSDTNKVSDENGTPSAVNEKQHKRDCLQRKRMRKMMIMQMMMMQHANPLMNPWMAGVPPAPQGGCCNHKRQWKQLQKQQAAGRNMVKDPNMEKDTPAEGRKGQKKQCRPGCQCKMSQQRMMMLQNSNPLMAPWMAVPPFQKGRCGKHSRQQKEGQAAEHDNVKDPEMLQSDDNERFQAEDCPVDVKHRENQPCWQHKKKLQRMMRMMQNAGPLMAPWEAAWFQQGAAGFNKQQRLAKTTQCDKRDSDSEDVDKVVTDDDMEDCLSPENTDAKQGVDNEQKKEMRPTKKRPGCSPCRKRRMQRIRAMQPQGYGHYPFTYPLMFRAGPNFRQCSGKSGCRDAQKPM